IVHHGGIGTSAQALRAGIAQVVIPLAYDQTDNAARLDRLGVAAVVTRREPSGAQLAGGLRQLLPPPRLPEKPATPARRLRFDPNSAVEDTCRLIEESATGSNA